MNSGFFGCSFKARYTLFSVYRAVYCLPSTVRRRRVPPQGRGSAILFLKKSGNAPAEFCGIGKLPGCAEPPVPQV